MCPSHTSHSIKYIINLCIRKEEEIAYNSHKKYNKNLEEKVKWAHM